MSDLIPEMDGYYNMNGYPEPEHVYLGKSTICVFTIFPRRQIHHPPSTDYNKYDSFYKNDSFYNPNEPLYYDIEFRSPFKEKDGKVLHDIDDANDWYLARNVDLSTAREMCQEFIEKWCKEKGLALQQGA